MKPVERGRFLTPAYDTRLTQFDIMTADWRQICPCRFGEARQSAVGLWSGDSYRYDIFEKGEGWDKQIALRWWNGGGEGWMVDVDKERRHETGLLRLIAGITPEADRWDYAHNLWETAYKTARAAEASERDRLFAAFCEGRMKRRKRGGKYIMEITVKDGEGVVTE
jgi:hypothetical protein